MPFRERMKRALRRASKSSSSSSSSSSNSAQPDMSMIYKPGEKMPMPKYRRPVAKEHKEKLEAFSFAGAWRRKSEHSLYSPMGSRMPSRRNSLNLGRKSFAERRENILVDEGTDEEGDVRNVGLSRQVSNSHHDDDLSSTATPHSSNALALKSAHPFTADDLSLALKKSHLDAPR